MNSKSFKIFLISFSIIILTLGVSAVKNYIPAELNGMYLALAITIAFGISIAGLVFGISDIRNGNLNAKIWVGIIGNVVVIVFFGLMVFTAVGLIGWRG